MANSNQIEANELGKNEKEATPNNSKKNTKETPEALPFFKLFRFATKVDILMMCIGFVASCGNGVTLPLMILIFSNIIDGFTSFGKLCPSNGTVISANNTNTTNATFPALSFNSITDQMRTQSLYLVGLAILTWILSYFQVAFWLMPSEKQARCIRSKLFESILKQDIGWFDVYKGGELTNRLTDDVNKIKDGMGDKCGNAIQYLSTCIAGFVLGFVKGWKLTLVILSLSPLLFISSVMFTKLTQVLTTNELKSYAKAGAIAEEVFTAIRTVFAFNGSVKEHKRYESKLDEARKYGIKKGAANGLLMGFLFFVINCAYALGFWYGWSLTVPDPVTGAAEYTVGKILLVFFSIIIGVFSLGNAGPFIGTSSNARAAAFEVFKIIDRKPSIDSSSNEGESPKEFNGNIEFTNVTFNYPSRQEVKILNAINFKIKAGSTVALVGGSGCGKSTCIQLLQRFYDPKEGTITIDNKDIKKLNINWLRDQIGVVNQEPVLFATTIYENIKFGKDDATSEQIQMAAMGANAHDFIMTLPDNYQTLVGDRGGQLSGGQKQRIAIARALVKNPKLLLLDEATSALDNESESIVQEALDKARVGRTTIIVAHRLSTIINADVIFAMDKGNIVEFGTHDELMKNKSLYYNLVIHQQNASTMSTQNKNNKRVALKDVEVNDKIKLKDEKPDLKEKNKEEKKQKKTEEPSMAKVFALNKPEWVFIFIGCISSLISGGIQPSFAIIFSKATAVFQECDINIQRERIVLYSVLFILLGILTFATNIIQNFMFGLSGENLTKRLRSRGFKCMLAQEIAWFDLPENNVGRLSTRLAVEAAAVQGATGIRIGGFFMSIGSMGVGIVIAFVYGWALCLLILGFVPFFILGGILQTKMLTGFSKKDKDVLEESGKLTNEAISNIRTVAISRKEKYFIEAYKQKLDTPYNSHLTRASIRSANIFAFLLGFSTSITFYAIAAAFSLGAHLVENRLFGTKFEDILTVLNVLMFSAQSVGQASSLMPDYAKAKAAIISMFELFERVPLINNYDCDHGIRISEQELDPSIQIKKIEFTYASRPDAKILKGIELEIHKSKKVAFVGSSGCGKSTVTQLIERFYDPNQGQILLSDTNLKDLSLHWLRSQIGIVSQEPILFDLSIAENIAYGDNSRVVNMDEIMEAAKKANIHDFITKLPQGYETNCGAKGTQLSGGQKQRIAIARALVRNPKILLLDEATSALDTESEKLVQEALDKAQEGRTCIIIAHRLSTIRNCDTIYVFQEGVVTEKGTHDELIKLNGFYAKLNGQQTFAEEAISNL